MTQHKIIGDDGELNKKIFKQYQSVYFFAFKVFPVLLLFTLVGLFFYFFVWKDGTNINGQEEKKARDIALNNYNKLYFQEETTQDIELIIKDGPFQQENTKVSSMGNLLKIKGWSMPHIVNIDTSDLPNIESFSKAGYDTDIFVNLIKDVIIRSNNSSNNQIPFLRTLLPLENIQKKFTLSCLNGIRVSDYICNTYIEKFLDSFFLYDLSKVDDQLIDNYLALTDDEQKKFCEGLSKYILFSHHTTEPGLNRLGKKCSKTNTGNLLVNKNFVSTKDSFSNGLISNKNVHYDETDIYLLLSLQQLIASDLNKGHVSISTIYSYLSVLDTVMLHTQEDSAAIAPIYYDWMIWFNEQYLKPKLEKIRYSQASLQKDIEKIIPELLKITYGKPSTGLKGLKYFMLNSAILKNKDSALNPKIIDTNPLTRAVELVNDLSFFILIDDYYQKGSDKQTIILEGYFVINLDGKKMNLNTKLTLDANDFRVRAIYIDGYKIFNSTLKKLLTHNFFSIPDLYQYVEKNLKFYVTNEQVDFCNILDGTFSSRAVVSPLGNSNSKSNATYKVYCSPEKVSIFAGMITYILSIDGLSISDIVVNEPHLQKVLNQKFVGAAPTEIDLIRLIEDIVYYRLPKEEEIFTGSTKVLVILDKIKEFMNIKATDIVEQDDIILAEIIVNKIPFIIYYDFKSNMIKEVFFKGIKIGGQKSLKVSNFNLELKRENQKNINLFLVEPLEYIKRRNPRVYLEYLRYTKGNKH